MQILGFDPGKDKCGIAVMKETGSLLLHKVVNSDEAIATVQTLVSQYQVNLLVLGNQTTAKIWQAKIKAALGELPVVLVDERYSSLEARDRYWQMYPPRGFQKLIPEGMRLPPRPIDDLVAILLIERYLETKTSL